MMGWLCGGMAVVRLATELRCGVVGEVDFLSSGRQNGYIATRILQIGLGLREPERKKAVGYYGVPTGLACLEDLAGGPLLVSPRKVVEIQQLERIPDKRTSAANVLIASALDRLS